MIQKYVKITKLMIKTLFLIILMFSTFMFSINKIHFEKSENVISEIDFYPLYSQNSDYNATVQINAKEILRELPPDLFGSNIQYVNYGDGVLEHDTHNIKSEIVQKFKDAGISTVRFPGGCHADLYHWRDAVGPLVNRSLGINYFNRENETNEYGTDEHIEFCRLINAEPTITVNFGNGTPQEAANWLEYCNSEIPQVIDPSWNITSFKGDENAPEGYFAWLRGEFGHGDPYNVKKWEIGNEVYNDWTKIYNSTDYAERFLDFYDTMKVVDPSIKIAAVGYDNAEGIYDIYGNDAAEWNREVTRIAGHKMDAIHIHSYQPLNDGYTVMLLYQNENKTRNFTVDELGKYQLKILAQGINFEGNYPPSDNQYSNLSIFVDNEFKGNITLNSQIAGYYYMNFTIITTGLHNITIAFTNDIYEPLIGDGRDAIFRGDIELRKGNKKIQINFADSSNLYDAIMAGPLKQKEEILKLKEILAEETGRDDIEIWLTEFNVWYNIYGFRLDQTLEFKSAIAAADMIIQNIYAGADIIQLWSLIENWVFGLIKDSLTLGERSIYKIYSLIKEGLGFYLLNSTIECPSFNLTKQFGNIQPIANVSYLDVLPTLDDDHLLITLINKHPSENLKIKTLINGISLKSTGIYKVINSSAPDSIDQNPNENSYKFSAGKVGQAIFLNASQPVFHTSYNNFFEEEGTIEFWFRPEWDGDDGKNHTIMSAGLTFFIGKSSDGYLYACFVAPDSSLILVATDVSIWKAGVWQHIAITWKQGKDLIMYINGSQVSSTPYIDKRVYIDQQVEMIFGTSIHLKINGSDGYFDELRILNTSRDSSDIQADYNAGNSGIPLFVCKNTTILFHFENSLLDSERDERTHLTIRAFTFNSNTLELNLSPCSISLVILSLDTTQSYSDGDSDDKKSENSENQIFWISLFIGGGLGVAVLVISIKIYKRRKF